MLRHTKAVKGLLGVLLFSVIIQGTPMNVQASTVDDLRAYLGYSVKERDPVMINTDKKENSSGENTKIRTTTELEQDISNLEENFIGGITGDTPASELVDMLQDIKTTRGKLKDSVKLQGIISNTDIGALIDNSEQYEKEKEEKCLFGSARYDIGEIGDHSISPTGKGIMLVTPFGYKVNPDRSYEAKNTTMDLGIGDGFNIVAQLNGKVAYIEPDDIQGGSIVTLFHGENLYTVYKHIVPQDLYVGKTISQGDVLGTSMVTTEAEEDKQNHIGYQVILDNKYINPILLFGNRGKDIYEDWLRRSYEVYSVEENENYYYKKSMSRENINNSDLGKNTIQGAAQVVGDYRLPDPGVVN